MDKNILKLARDERGVSLIITFFIMIIILSVVLSISIILYSEVKVIRNNRNLGKGASLRRGFEYALSHKYETVIAMDGDGQHLPPDIRNFLTIESLSPEADMIVGNRMRHPIGMPRIRRLTNIIMSGLISRMCGQSIPDTQNGFRLIRARLLGKLELTSNKFEIESEVIIKAAAFGARVISIPIASVYKNHSSRINPFLDTFRFIRFILPYISFSVTSPNPNTSAYLSPPFTGHAGRRLGN